MPSLKSLLIGAPPRAPFSGPWVDISHAGLWGCLPMQDLAGCVVIEIEGPDRRIPLNGEPVQLSGTRARAVVVADLPECESITILLREAVYEPVFSMDD